MEPSLEKRETQLSSLRVKQNKHLASIANQLAEGIAKSRAENKWKLQLTSRRKYLTTLQETLFALRTILPSQISNLLTIVFYFSYENKWYKSGFNIAF